MKPCWNHYGISLQKFNSYLIISNRSSRNQYANILITSESIVPTLAKLLISEQSSMIPAENVYSTLRMSKESVIDRILSRFGKKCSFVIISTHLDTHEIAKKVRFLFSFFFYLSKKAFIFWRIQVIFINTRR